MTCVPHSTSSTAQHFRKAPLLQGTEFHAESVLQSEAAESQDLSFAVGVLALVAFAVMTSQKLRRYRERRAEPRPSEEGATAPLAARSACCWGRIATY